MLFILCFCHHLHPASLRFRECRPPSHFSRKNPHAVILKFMHTHTSKHTEIYAHPPASCPPSAIHAQKPTHSNPTHPLIPPSFFRYPLGRFDRQKAAQRTQSRSPHMKRTQKKKGQSDFRSSKVEHM